MRTISTLTLALLLSSTACKKPDATSDNPAPNPKATPTPAAPPAPPPPPKVATGEDMAKRYVECWGFLSAKNWDQFKTCYAPGAVSEMMDSGMPTANGWDDILAKHTKPVTDAFADLKGDVELTLINGHNGVTVALLSGTQTGAMKTPMGDVPATNKKFGIQVAHAVHFADDGSSVDKQSFYEDMGEMAGQLGLSKAPVRPAADKPMQDNEIVIAKDDDTEKKNLDAIKQTNAAFNKHDAAALDALMADDLVWSEIGVPKDWNKAEAKISNAGLFKGFSDIKLEPSTSWAAGNYVVEQGVMSGTNDGAMPAMGLPKKTGKSLHLQYLQVWKLKDGKVTRSWGFWNSTAFAMQLGLMPPPKVPATK